MTQINENVMLANECREGAKTLKNRIGEMVEEMNNQRFLEMIYGFIERMYQEEKAEG